MAMNRENVSAEKLSAPFVKTDAASLLNAVVIMPTAAVEGYAPLKAEPHAIAERAQDQHTVLVRRLEALRVKLRVVAAGTTALGSAAADLAVVVADGAILMRPSDLGRAADLIVIESILREFEIPILGRIEAPGMLDGGDVIVTDDRIFVAVPHGAGRYERRSNSIGRGQLAALLGLPLVEVPVDAHFPRLRSVASVIDANTVIIGGNALEAGAFDGFEVIKLPLGEEYAAGVITLGPRFVLANLRFQESPAIMRNAKIKMESFDLWEFGKLGLAPSTLVLALKRR